MRPVYTSRARPAQSWRQRMTVAPRELRAAVGKNVAMVAKRRKELQDETIYQRAPTDRPLTGNLKRNEFVAMRGMVAEVGNRARYAQRRNDMTGTSVTYGHELDSNWAGRSVTETRSERLGNIRAAMRRVNAQKANA